MKHMNFVPICWCYPLNERKDVARLNRKAAFLCKNKLLMWRHEFHNKENQFSGSYHKPMNVGQGQVTSKNYVI